MFHLIDKEYGTALIFRGVHQRSHSLAVVRRNQTIQIAILYHRTDRLIGSDRLLREFFFLIGHVFRLNLHAQTTGHGYIKAEFKRHYTPCLMIRGSTDMLRHRNGRIEIRGPPLDKQTLQGIGIVTNPKLIEIRHYSIADTSATASAGLNHYIRIFSPNPFHHSDQTTVIIYIDMRLLILRQIRRTVVQQFTVCVPLDIGNIRIVCQ